MREERGMRWKSEENEERLLIMLNTEQNGEPCTSTWFGQKIFKKIMINKEIKKKNYSKMFCVQIFCVILGTHKLGTVAASLHKQATYNLFYRHLQMLNSKWIMGGN